MQNFSDGLFKYILSIYNAWLMVIMSVVGIVKMMPNDFTAIVILHIVTLALFSPTIYQYHIKKSINEFGEKLHGSST